MTIFSFFIDFKALVRTKLRKWPCLSYSDFKRKNKGTLFLQTVKVGEDKVPLFSCLGFFGGFSFSLTKAQGAPKLQEIFPIAPLHQATQSIPCLNL